MKTIQCMRASLRCVICLFVCVSGYAQPWKRTIQQFQHTTWGPKDGAPSPITALAQTPDGLSLAGRSRQSVSIRRSSLRALPASVGRAIPGRCCEFPFGPTQWRPLDRLSIRRDQPSEKQTRNELHRPRRSGRGSGMVPRAGSGRNDMGSNRQRAVAAGR
jgi:hypothetical protein